MSQPLHTPMVERDPDEPHRASTPLELFFDLAMVVAVSASAAELHHAVADGHYAHGVLGFVMVFFGVWWAWVNYTWFSSAYDTDDVPMRFLTMVQMAGVLVLAAGVSRAFEHDDFGVTIIGYVIMRLALVVQWLRARHESGDPHGICGRYALGVFVVQALWVGWWFLPHAFVLPGFVVLVVAEMLVPVFAEYRQGGSSWHLGHVVERYGLFVIITCGEVILSCSGSFAAATEHGFTGQLVMVGVGSLLVVFSMWWFYFQHDSEADVRRRGPWAWAYGHFFVFASVAATGAGIAVMVERAEEHAHLEMLGPDLVLSCAIAVYLGALGYVHHVIGGNLAGAAISWVLAVVVLVIGVLGRSPGTTTLTIGLVMVAALLVLLRLGVAGLRGEGSS